MMFILLLTLGINSLCTNQSSERAAAIIIAAAIRYSQSLRVCARQPQILCGFISQRVFHKPFKWKRAFSLTSKNPPKLVTTNKYHDKKSTAKEARTPRSAAMAQNQRSEREDDGWMDAKQLATTRKKKSTIIKILFIQINSNIYSINKLNLNNSTLGWRDDWFVRGGEASWLI